MFFVLKLLALQIPPYYGYLIFRVLQELIKSKTPFKLRDVAIGFMDYSKEHQLECWSAGYVISLASLVYIALKQGITIDLQFCLASIIGIAPVWSFFIELGAFLLIAAPLMLIGIIIWAIKHPLKALKYLAIAFLTLLLGILWIYSCNRTQPTRWEEDIYG